MTTSELTLALSGIVLSSGLCLLLFVRGFHRPFPSFFAYALFSVAASIGGLLIHNRLSAYFYFYWVSEVFYIGLALAALQEIIKIVFRNFYGLRWFRLVFPLIGTSLVLVAVLHTLVTRNRAIGNPLFESIIALEILVRLLQFGLLVLFFAFVRLFHMRWRQVPLGIALGFGISAAGFLVVFLLRSEFGTKFDPMVRITPPMAYIIAVVVWLVTFTQGEPARKVTQAPALTPEEMIAELKRHTQAVKGILGR